MKRFLAAAGLAASLLASPVLGQTPQTGTATQPSVPPAAKAAPAQPSVPPAAKAAPAQPAAKTPLIDINTASKDELDKLPGVGPARAEAIIKNRPYGGKDELVRKKVLPENVYKGIRERIIARQT